MLPTVSLLTSLVINKVPCGLVDCKSPDKFDEELQQLELVWKAGFYHWFLQYYSNNMKEKMLCPLREAVGLAKIPNEYTNNANESKYV